MTARPTATTGRTRAAFLRAAVAGAAAATGAGAWAIHGGAGDSLAAPSADTDADILNFFLHLESVQADFYREAVRGGRLDGGLLTFARTVAGEERRHVRFLEHRLGGRARTPKRARFDDALWSPRAFREAAIELEEATVAGYVGQGANLTAAALTAVVTLCSVEARQAAWIRDLAGTSPAPRAADPARSPDAVLARLRRKGLIA